MMTELLGSTASVLSLSLQLIAKSSGYLLAGLTAAGLFHRFMKRTRARKSLSSPGFRSISSGLLTGLALPICSCGTLPVAVELQRQGATRESIAAFLISTPEDSPDAVFLTAGLFGWAFAAVRVAAGLLAACFGGVLVIGAETWGKSDAPDIEVGPAVAEKPRAGRALSKPYRLLRLWWNISRRRWNSFQLAKRSRPATNPPSQDSETSSPGASREDVVATGRITFVPDRILRGAGRVVRESVSYGLGDMLDEIAWPLLVGFLASGILASFLPTDLAARIPGGLAGQFVFAAIIAVPLNVCASGTIPLAAVLVSRGLFPAAALMIFLTGPLTNPASLLVLRRHFGGKFIQALLISCFSASVVVGILLHTARRSLTGPGYTGQPLLTGGVSPTEIVLGILFGTALLLSLLRVGWRRGRAELIEAAEGIIPQGARRVLRAARSRFTRANRTTLAGTGAAIAILLWLAQGLRVVPFGSVALRQTLGRVSRNPLSAGWHWSLPPPLGSLKLVPAAQLLKVDVGFRAAPVSDYRGIEWDPFSEYWHSIYTTTGDNPDESSFVTGDQNLVEIKAALHLVVSDPYQLAIRTRDGVEAVRPPFLSVMNRLLATRDIDRSLTEGRAELEDAARRQLQEALDRGGIPLKIYTVNILDFHPPQETVSAFRDVGSAAEEKERRIFEARGKLDSAVPLARGEAASELATARADRTEKTSRAAGESRSFELQAAASAATPAAARLRFWWNSVERALSGQPKVIFPANVEPEIFDLGGTLRTTVPQKGVSPQ